MLRINNLSRLGKSSLARQLSPVLLVLMSAYSGSALAALAQEPLFLALPAQPNIMYSLDNSGSMQWGSVTGYDGLFEYTATSTSGTLTGPVSNATRDKRAYYSSSYNSIWYNPATTYAPPVDYLGSNFSPSSPTGARLDPYPTVASPFSSNTLDLTAVCYAPSSTPTLPIFTYTKNASNIWSIGPNTTNCKTISDTGSGTYKTKVSRYAFYYIWDGNTNIKTATPSDSAFPTRIDISTGTTYSKVAGKDSRLDCGTGTTCSGVQELQNFANWFSYYRTRILMTKSAMGLAFSPIDPVVTPNNTPRFRVGFNAINAQASDGSTTVDNTGVTDSASWLTIRAFDTAQKQDFYTKLYGINPGNGTPLRAQMDRIGKLYSGTLASFDYTNNDPYFATNPRTGTADKTLLSCRASYHIMSTDGYWNSAYSGVSGDYDGTADGKFVTQASGTLDAKKTSSTLADIAMYYYMTDLRPTLADKAGTKNDPLATQHMRTFTIGLGANGNLTYQSNYDVATSGDFFDIKAGTKNWGVPKDDDKANIDDLWHAAVNGRGHYYSAGNPTDLKDGLVKILKEIGGSEGAAASVATTGNKASGATNIIYVPSFESGTWAGHLKKITLKANGDEDVIVWDAATLIPAWNSRNIVTWNPVSKSAVAFDWLNLTTGVNSQQAALGDTDVLEYLKGNRSKEQVSENSATGYRYRTAVAGSPLGDIVNSAPKYVSDEDFGYSGLSSIGAAYDTYLGTKTAKTPMVYAGANDGMLHAFNGTTGVETFAYIPNSVYGNLKSLSDKNYGHRYFVDGHLTANDFHNGSAWKTVLVGSTGAGLTSSIFALDISSPDSLGTGSVMWEKTAADTGLANLGNVMGDTSIGRLPNGESVILVANGPDSASYKASLFLIKVSDGTVVKEFEVDATATAAAPNGLSAPAPLFNRNHELVGAYAGDIKGNLWKFSFVNAASPTTVAYSYSKLFTTNMDATGLINIQPIVQKPNIQIHPNGGFLVTVGTGRFMVASDKANKDIQSIYGIWDKAGSTAVIDHADLVQQTLTDVSESGKLVGRTLTSNTIDWTSKKGWYIDLLVAGERVVGDLLFSNAKIIVATTFVPVADLCGSNGDSQLMGFNGLSGAANSTPLFGTTTNLSSIVVEGTLTNPTLINTGSTSIAKINTSKGTLEDKPFNPGASIFRTWRQIIFKN
ncbi:pilus assembly protein [Undibacterium sp. Ren11W]|uniref:pilus assembly protein n=1 Tax=Undibacterium sp. Ren11W TaxID=3413045 RepID=UPI003BF2EE18